MIAKLLFEIMCMPSMYHISTSVVVSNGGAPTCTNWHITVSIFYKQIKVVWLWIINLQFMWMAKWAKSSVCKTDKICTKLFPLPDNKHPSPTTDSCSPPTPLPHYWFTLAPHTPPPLLIHAGPPHLFPTTDSRSPPTPFPHYCISDTKTTRSRQCQMSTILHHDQVIYTVVHNAYVPPHTPPQYLRPA